MWLFSHGNGILESEKNVSPEHFWDCTNCESDLDPERASRVDEFHVAEAESLNFKI